MRKEMTMGTVIEQARQAQIRHLNDQFRCHGFGYGSVLVTAGIDDKGPLFVSTALNAVRSFDRFTNDNDPHGEHDFGSLDVLGERLFFKIDYYDALREAGSPDPADKDVTHRVLTIMLASEY
jgi:Protein of unknown function (DUF3768)